MGEQRGATQDLPSHLQVSSSRRSGPCGSSSESPYLDRLHASSDGPAHGAWLQWSDVRRSARGSRLRSGSRLEDVGTVATLTRGAYAFVEKVVTVFEITPEVAPLRDIVAIEILARRAEGKDVDRHIGLAGLDGVQYQLVDLALTRFVMAKQPIEAQPP